MSTWTDPSEVSGYTRGSTVPVLVCSSSAGADYRHSPASPSRVRTQYWFQPRMYYPVDSSRRKLVGSYVNTRALRPSERKCLGWASKRACL